MFPSRYRGYGIRISKTGCAPGQIGELRAGVIFRQHQFSFVDSCGAVMKKGKEERR
jgi:hypothetical protein